MTQQQWGDKPPQTPSAGAPQWNQPQANQPLWNQPQVNQPLWNQPQWNHNSGGQWNQPSFGSSPTAQSGSQANFGRAPQGPGFTGSQLGQPHYAPGQFNPPAPRKRNPLRGLLLALMALALVAFVGFVVTNLASPTSDVAYQNDDFEVPPPDKNPPPLPVPETFEEAQQFVANNPFYQQTSPIPVRCNARPINVATASDAVLKAHFETLMECTVRVWQPPVEDAGFQIVRPSVTIYGKQVTTKCGKAEVNAFYCSADQQVYFSNLLPDYVAIVKEDKWAADVVMAHEFGHALQARTGILISSHALGQNANDEAFELQMSRRLETQADCFAGMFTRAVSVSLGIQQSDLTGIASTFVAVGDDTLTGKANVVGNHGRGATRRYWGLVGLGTSAVGKCNTFTAGPTLVR